MWRSMLEKNSVWNGVELCGHKMGVKFETLDVLWV